MDRCHVWRYQSRLDHYNKACLLDEIAQFISCYLSLIERPLSITSILSAADHPIGRCNGEACDTCPLHSSVLRHLPRLPAFLC